MRILCKFKDFYDFAQSYNPKDPVLLNRQNCLVLDNQFIFKLARKAEKDKTSKKVGRYFKDYKSTGRFYTDFILRTGFVFYAFRAYCYRVRDGEIYKDPPKDRSEWTNVFDSYCGHWYDCKLDEIQFLGSRIDYTYKGLPIEVQTFQLKDQKQRKLLRTNDEDLDILQASLQECEFESVNCTYGYKDQRQELLEKIPVIQNTCIMSLVGKEIDPVKVYSNIEEYILASKNDKDQESKGLTDVDKALNHGFDKKTSFRNVK